jgi:hypothetical protein
MAMDWGLMIPIVAIVMGISIPITAIKLKHREKIEQMRLAAGGNNDSARAAQQDAKIDLLEDRIAVLERIVTDRGYGLASEIEALRDARSDNGVPLEIGRQQERR